MNNPPSEPDPEFQQEVQEVIADERAYEALKKAMDMEIPDPPAPPNPSAPKPNTSYVPGITDVTGDPDGQMGLDTAGGGGGSGGGGAGGSPKKDDPMDPVDDGVSD